MGSIFNRGTVAEPLWYAQYKDATGKFKMVPTHKATKKEAKAVMDDLEQKVKDGIEIARKPRTFSELGDEWVRLLDNRNAQDDTTRYQRHLRPAFGHLKVTQIDLRCVLAWLDAMRAGTAPTAYADKKRGKRAAKLSESSMRSNLNLLSRFFSWAVPRGYAPHNVVKDVPTKERPHQPIDQDAPWIADDSVVRKLMNHLPTDAGLMFYLGNRSGLRPGEACGLRMIDLAQIDEGRIHVRFSEDGPLKEDKSTGKDKWVPAPDDARAVLGTWLVKREAEGAQPEDFVFPNPRRKAGCHTPQHLQRAWRAAREEMATDGVEIAANLTPYRATRHSFVSVKLSEGATLDEVSGAVGHSSPVVTKRYYAKYVRKDFSDKLRAGLGTKPTTPEQTGKMIPIKAANS